MKKKKKKKKKGVNNAKKKADAPFFFARFDEFLVNCRLNLRIFCAAKTRFRCVFRHFRRKTVRYGRHNRPKTANGADFGAKKRRKTPKIIDFWGVF
jgi:hypothetical protein